MTTNLFLQQTDRHYLLNGIYIIDMLRLVSHMIKVPNEEHYFLAK